MAIVYFSLQPAYGQNVDVPAILEQPRKTIEARPLEKPLEKDDSPKVTAKEAGPLNIEAPEGANKIVFKLKGLVVKGSSIYTDEDLKKYYESYLNNDIILSQIYMITGAIKQRYRDDGYILAQVLVPEQDIKDGIVTLQIVEGHIGEINYTGDSKSQRMVERILKRVKKKQAFRINNLEKAMLLVNDIPGVTAKSTLIPANNENDPGSVNLQVEFLEEKKLQQAFSLDNGGSRYIGPFQTGYNAKLVNVLPNQETTVNVLTSLPTDELVYGGIKQKAVVNKYGTTVSGDLSHSYSSPGYNIKSQDIESKGFYGTLDVSHPILRTRNDNFTLASSFSLKDVEATVFKGLPLYEDRVRSISLSALYDGNDRYLGNNLAAFQITRGLNVFGARETGDPFMSRSEGVSDFTKLNLTVARLQQLKEKVALYISGRGQYSKDPLLASEEFSYGGNVSGRGYDPSEFSGDDGLAGTIELRLKLLPDIGHIRNHEVYTFYDLGKVWNKDNITADKDSAASSVGAGMRFSLGENLSADVNFAVPLSPPAVAAPSGNGKQPRANFSIYAPF